MRRTRRSDSQLYEDGGLVQELLTSTSITSTTGQLATATWDADLLADVSGGDVELRLIGDVGSAGGGTPGALPAHVGTVSVGFSFPAALNTTTNKTIEITEGLQVGDLLILYVDLYSTNNNGSLNSILGNWTQLGGAGHTYGGANTTRVGAGYHIVEFRRQGVLLSPIT